MKSKIDVNRGNWNAGGSNFEASVLIDASPGLQ